MSNKISTIIRVAVLTACVVLCVFAYVIYGDTIIPFRESITIPLLAAAVTAPFLYRRWAWLTTSANKYFNIVFHILFAGCIFYSAFLLCNFYISDPQSAYTEEAVVKSKEVKKSRKTRRIGRRRYAYDGMRYEYCLQVALPDNTLKEITVSRNIYNRTRIEYPIILSLEEGLFGYPVIKEISTKKTIY